MKTSPIRALLKGSACWREQQARVQKLLRLVAPAGECSDRLEVSLDWERELVVACNQWVVAFEMPCSQLLQRMDVAANAAIDLNRRGH